MSDMATLPDIGNDEIAALHDRIRIMQKFGTRISDEQIAEQLELEQRAARHAIELEKNIERSAQDRIRIDREVRQIARDELGKRIFVSLNKTRIMNLDVDGNVPCPGCGRAFPEGTNALMKIADLLRDNANPYDLIGWGGFRGVPYVYTGGSCPHCGAGASVLVQLVI